MSDNKENQQAAKEGGAREEGGLLWWLKPMLIAIGCVIVFRLFIAEPFVVPTGSMKNTIMPGNAVLTEKVSYRFTSPAAGSIVVFNNPSGNGTVLVKRVIATAGQTVDLQNGRVIVDGELLDEPYVEGRPSEPLPVQMAGVGPLTYPLTVPDGCVWVMGDNRTDSSDSRFFGPVHTSEVFGRAFLVVWPFTSIKPL